MNEQKILDLLKSNQLTKAKQFTENLLKSEKNNITYIFYYGLILANERKYKIPEVSNHNLTEPNIERFSKNPSKKNDELSEWIIINDNTKSSVFMGYDILEVEVSYFNCCPEFRVIVEESEIRTLFSKAKF